MIETAQRFHLVLFLLVFNILSGLGSYTFAQDNLKLHYSFENLTSNSTQVVDDSGNGYNATFNNGACTRQMGTYRILDLGSANGYLDLGTSVGTVVSSLKDFSIATYLYIDESTSLTNAGNFVWSFGNSNNLTSYAYGGMFFTAKSTRYAISLTNWAGEKTVNYGTAFTKGAWKHLVYVQSGTSGSVYVDGILIKSGSVSLTPSSLNATPYNYIGRSLYSSDVYLLNSYFADFRIYNTALSGSEITSLSSNLSNLNNALIEQQLSDAANALVLVGLSQVKTSITLPSSTSNDITITWSSSDISVITNQGEVTRPAIGKDSASIILTATLSKNGQSVTKSFSAIVLPFLDDQTSVETDAAEITISGNLSNLRTNLSLPVTGLEGSIVTWQSANSAYLTALGKLQKLGAIGGGKILTVLTATIVKGNASIQKTFDIYIAEDEGYSAYLFVYFTGNDNTLNEEAIRFAVSNDGYTYRALNNNKPILASSAISSTGGVRDPHIYRGLDGKYYMVATDMVSANGWSSNRAIVLLRSEDLVNWTSSIVNIETKYGYTDLLRVWAPQTIYDEQTGKFMIYFSMKRGDGPDIMYYTYANDNFTDIVVEPKQLYYSPTNSSCIDGDIIYKDGKYNLFHKTESSGNGIKKAISDNLTSGYVLYDQYLQQTTVSVEGSSVFKLINSDDYILMYDMYTSGTYQFTKSSDLVNFVVIDDAISMNFTPRHGTVMPITAAEAKKLAEKWGTKTELFVTAAEGAYVKKLNVDIDTTLHTVYVPVKRDADLSSLDPGLKTLPGATISPDGVTTFSSGSVNYTLSISGVGSQTYAVTSHVDNNPVVEGYFADPEILYSQKTGKYYLYPTSDGFISWSGTYFKCFSSDNLVDWNDEGIILNLSTDVSWGTTNAWAPTIVERKINGVFKYFYYFCAAKSIGVAVSDSPIGPFVDSGVSLISSLPSGVSSGQQIDPDVFHDPVSNKYYIYWGNTYMACAELNDDMITINTSSTKVMTPNSTYNEGTEVAYRNGIYYFFWSENDTRSEDYRVRYATSSSPTGALTVPSSNMVIAKDADKGIYATGHNCVIQIPGTDEWYIIYHRFTRPKGISMGTDAGFYREVCIDKLEFNSDGSIKQVQPTLEGISPVTTTVTNVNKTKTSSLLRIYPNPSKNVLNVAYPLVENSMGTITVYNIYGQKLIQCSAVTDLTQLDISALSANVYLLSYSIYNKVVFTDKFLVGIRN